MRAPWKFGQRQRAGSSRLHDRLPEKMPSKTLKTFQARDSAAWREWLAGHHDSESEVWLVFHKQHTGQPCVAYSDALDEALCFGWVDNLVKRLDDERYAR